MKYLFAVRVRECDEKESKYCIFKSKENKGSICNTKQLMKCPYPLRNNPICTADTVKSCSNLFQIADYKKDRFIFYYCSNCNHCLKLTNKEIENKILKSLNSEDIYYGKDLKELLKKVDLGKNDYRDIEEILTFFQKVFKGGSIETL